MTSVETSAEKSAVTFSRPVAVGADKSIRSPGVARSNIASSTEHPQGTKPWASQHKNYTVLQQHILFWDRDQDGQIYPVDIYRGFRDLGFNIIFSILAAVIISIGISYPTRLAHSYLPDPFFRIYVDSIHKAKHGSDSGVIDNEGRFVPQNFENLFAKYAKEDKSRSSLTLSELFLLMHGQRSVLDPFGWCASILEFSTTWLLIQKDRKIQKEDLRKVYDGSLFWDIEAKRRNGTGWDKGFKFGRNSMWAIKSD
ncbi:Caleosin related protein-domain-containing protein [Lipomyces doorenjongii]